MLFAAYPIVQNEPDKLANLSNLKLRANTEILLVSIFFFRFISPSPFAFPRCSPSFLGVLVAPVVFPHTSVLVDNK